MKNIQGIDDAVNCTYEVFGIDDEGFALLFPDGTDIEFEDDVFARLGAEQAAAVLERRWRTRQDKKTIHGIHGTFSFGSLCEEQRPFYPTKRTAEDWLLPAISPDRTAGA